MRLTISTILLALTIAEVTFAVPKVDTKAKAETNPTIRELKLQDYLAHLSGEQMLEKMDSSGKGTPDIFVVFKKLENGGRQLEMQLFDLNRDNKIDLAKHFENAKMTRTEMDLDYDGVVDVVSLYDTKTGEIQKKVQADGSTNIWKFYFKNELRKKEVDRNQDGKPDMWVYYRNGKILRTEIDQNFDGKAVRVEGPLAQPKGKKGSS